MSWNLWWRFGDWQARRRAILAVLAAAQPDLCGLQEVWADRDANLAEWLAGELGMHWAWGPAGEQQGWHDRIGDPSVDFGVAILSRWPIREPHVAELPDDASRPALSALIDAPHATVPFVTTHLSSMPWHSGRRIRQLTWLAEHAATRSVDAHPPVVTGDFNAMPDSDEIRRFQGVLTEPAYPGLSFIDAWRFADPADPGFTWDRRNPAVAVGPVPSARIDYVHIGLRWHGPGQVRSVRLAGTEPVDGVWPSDHAAVVADLSEA
ncbi:endonuclease/exonuclease/phosphatase family metal-dependent hydrolase [Allocatelliglobosispora scoriae]|uniref:Endonuclease/exonuclease/phosphatase family metal-dependent hydrolase n=1 Tax=Allocatelliglobosispora scoriae TaxID=643052 RepID=A0A841BK57_9ACTN|nr:endonuclease/exonuclease/phosphatase family protein [Allocatelliglobosispora scoriae]MBB5868025.1 endonuclease/exonuclease/phosphatase family metal-dependent hydrolase [Allocatelliglobosispora scoriae]